MHTETLVRRCYTAIRRELPAPAPITVLHIGPEHTVVMAGTDAPVTRSVAIGTRRTARGWLRHTPPTPLEMEQAIAAVEEEVMPLRAMIPEGSALYMPGAVLEDIAAADGALPPDERGTPLSIESVEQIFNRLVAVSAGRPASQEPLPLDGAFFARVLILREFMHHLGFVSVIPRCARQAPSAPGNPHVRGKRA